WTPHNRAATGWRRASGGGWILPRPESRRTQVQPAATGARRPGESVGGGAAATRARTGAVAFLFDPLCLPVQRCGVLLLATLAVQHVGEHAGTDHRCGRSDGHGVAAHDLARGPGAGTGGAQRGTGANPVFGVVAGVA